MSENYNNYNNCQSCGLPLSPIIGIGTNSDGTKSEKYCDHCFRDGSFVFPEITKYEMHQHVKRKLTEFGFTDFLARLFASGISKLERWKQE